MALCEIISDRCTKATTRTLLRYLKTESRCYGFLSTLMLAAGSPSSFGSRTSRPDKIGLATVWATKLPCIQYVFYLTECEVVAPKRFSYIDISVQCEVSQPCFAIGFVLLHHAS
jgi:hypothetical protein